MMAGSPWNSIPTSTIPIERRESRSIESPLFWPSHEPFAFLRPTRAVAQRIHGACGHWLWGAGGRNHVAAPPAVVLALARLSGPGVGVLLFRRHGPKRRFRRRP